MKSTLQCTCSAPTIPVLDKAAETIWRLVNAVLTCPSTPNSYDFLVIFDGDRKLSSLLSTESVWIPLKTKVVLRLSCNLPAGDHFWKFSHQCSIFDCTYDLRDLISSPTVSEKCYYINCTSRKPAILNFNKSCSWSDHFPFFTLIPAKVNLTDYHF